MPPSPPKEGYTLYDPIDPFENHAGPFFWQQGDDGLHHFVMQAESRHCNRYGMTHGGLLMTMIDLCMVAAAKESREEALITVSLNSEFVDAGRDGELIEGIGELTRRTRSLAFARGRIFTGDRTLLTASAVLKRINPN